ncbi:unnamed protein product [Brassica rapa]|uniref:Uncharacterized protein n=2 Tax=Brassica TaxID=3705 RepID=A0A8D9GXQ4_BRACM|nr:unnamed protein product [Brassica napus]CAG7888913.1 unnamed protein product [Brassica rapa]CDY48402.1 BnaAnng09710D [Brassica napus]
MRIQIPDQDTVRLITGSWLVKMVKSTLRIVAPNVSIKLSYQYPSWMQIDAGDGSTPQFISDDYDVESFVHMRRKIEEVNLYVTILEHNNGF